MGRDDRKRRGSTCQRMRNTYSNPVANTDFIESGEEQETKARQSRSRSRSPQSSSPHELFNPFGSPTPPPRSPRISPRQPHSQSLTDGRSPFSQYHQQMADIHSYSTPERESQRGRAALRGRLRWILDPESRIKTENPQNRSWSRTSSASKEKSRSPEGRFLRFTESRKEERQSSRSPEKRKERQSLKDRLGWRKEEDGENEKKSGVKER